MQANETTGEEAPARNRSIDRAADCYKASTTGKSVLPDGGRQQQCWICQQPIEGAGEPRRYHDEPVHGECHPDTAADGRLVTDGGRNLTEQWPSATATARIGGPVTDGGPDAQRCQLCGDARVSVEDRILETLSPVHEVAACAACQEYHSIDDEDEICPLCEERPARNTLEVEWDHEGAEQAFEGALLSTSICHKCASDIANRALAKACDSAVVRADLGVDDAVDDDTDRAADAHGQALRTDGSGHTCDACGESFKTLTKLRLHEKDDCQARATYDELDPDGDDVGRQAAEGLLTCRECGAENRNADYDQTTSFADGDFHLICEFACRSCGFENENRVVMTGVDEETLEDLPPHLQPDDQEIATDGGQDTANTETTGNTAIDASPGIGERVTYVDGDGTAHRALVTWVFGNNPGAAPMINCVHGEDFELGETDATDGDYGSRVAHKTSVQHRTDGGDTHVYVRGWSE